jgi:hypothetical protein
MAADLVALRDPLLELHRALLNAERLELERIVGKINPAEFLRLVLDDPQFAWIAPLTELVAIVDYLAGTPEEKVDGNAPAPQELIASLTKLLTPPDPESSFGSRYLELLQLDPGVVVTHGTLAQQLGSGPTGGSRGDGNQGDGKQGGGSQGRGSQGGGSQGRGSQGVGG